jgi:hypothetical protein
MTVFLVDTQRISLCLLLYLPSQGSSVSGFATDIYGQMVEGVVISRETAQLAFENAVCYAYIRTYICRHEQLKKDELQL